MSWRDKLLPASYKGVPFKVKSSEHEFGRRIELKQFPNNDGPVVQDFGEAASEFEIEAFVIASIENGFDYFEERDAVIAAFKEIKQGTLVHPYYGTIQVYPIERARISEDIDEGGIARITMRFARVYEAEQKLILPSSKKQAPNVTLESAPTDASDFNSLVDDSMASADDDAADFFYNAFNQARSFADNMKSAITSSMNKVQAALFRVKNGISTLVAETTGQITSVLLTIDNIIDTPCSITSSLKVAARSFSTICGIGSSGVFGGIIGGCSGVARGEITELDGVTIPASLGKSVVDEGLSLEASIDESDLGFIPAAQLNNIISCNDMVKYFVLSSLMQVAIRISFLSQEDLLTYANKISEAVDDFIIRLGAEKDDSEYDYNTDGDFIDNTLLFSAVQDLKNVFVQSMNAKAVTVAKKVTYDVPPEILSVLQVAYSKYEDLDRQDEIYEMNRLFIRHPGFIPSGGSINILNE